MSEKYDEQVFANQLKSLSADLKMRLDHRYPAWHGVLAKVSCHESETPNKWNAAAMAVDWPLAERNDHHCVSIVFGTLKSRDELCAWYSGIVDGLVASSTTEALAKRATEIAEQAESTPTYDY